MKKPPKRRNQSTANTAMQGRTKKLTIAGAISRRHTRSDASPPAHGSSSDDEPQLVDGKTAERPRKLIALASHSSALLCVSWPRSDTKNLLGFAFRRIGPDGQPEFLPTLLRFPGQPHKPGELFPSNQAPIQRMIWVDAHLQAGTVYKYEAIPVRGTPAKLVLDEHTKLLAEIRTDDNQNETIELWFNSASRESQEYVDQFGDTDPTVDPEGPAAKWLAAGLDDAIIGFINRAVKDTSLTLDMAAYHLDHPTIIKALCNVGKRARVSLDFIAQLGKEKKAGPQLSDFVNGPAYKQLADAGVNVHKRTKGIAISHNKYIILKDRTGRAVSVLMGSTNFTKSGVIIQANVSIILHVPEIAAHYLENFERVFADDTPGLRKIDETWGQTPAIGDPAIEVNFSPHELNSRVDLGHYVDLAKQARESLFFATFSLTDKDLIEALAAPPPNIVSRGVVDQLNERGDPANAASSPLIVDAFKDADPAVVAAFGFSENSKVTRVEHARRGPVDVFVHHKMIVRDFGLSNCAVVVGSANYSNNSSHHNDENTLVFHGDHRIAQRFTVNFFRMFQRFESRWLLARAERASRLGPAPTLPKDEAVDGAGTVNPTLEIDGRWTDQYYDGSNTAKLLELLLRPEASPSAAALAVTAKPRVPREAQYRQQAL